MVEIASSATAENVIGVGAAAEPMVLRQFTTSSMPLVLQCRDFNHVAAELFCQLFCMDFVTALANDVHHVYGNDNRYAHLKKLRSEVKIALKVAAINDVQDGIGLFLDKEISRNNFFQGIGDKE